MQSKAKIFAIASIAVAVLAACNKPEKGLDAKLDATQGYDVNYHASLTKAFLDMSKEQQAAYNWVVEPLTQEYFIAYYGKTPTVRAVIGGQLDKFEESNAIEIASQVVALAEKATEVVEIVALQKKSRELLNTVTTTATVGSAGKQNESVCKGIACTASEANDQVLIVDYDVKNPNNLKLLTLPCSIVITTEKEDTYTSPLNYGCAHAGHFQQKIKVPTEVDLKTSKYQVTFKDDEAITSGYDPAIPDDHAAVKRMKYLEGVREKIAKVRKTLN